MNAWLFDHSVCPRDKQALQSSANELSCPQGHRYPVFDTDLLPFHYRMVIGSSELLRKLNRVITPRSPDFRKKESGRSERNVFYSKQIGKELFFATTAENAPSQKENVAAIWNVSADGECAEIAKFHKDAWHGTLFMFGTIHFPYANMIADELYFSVVGVKEDNQTFRIRRAA